MIIQRGLTAKLISGGVAVAFLTGPLFCAAVAAPAASESAAFENQILPFFAKNCYVCHNAKLKTAGLDLQAYTDPGSVAKDRDKWEVVLRKLKSGEMPPKGIPRPKQAELQTVTQWLQGEFERADRQVKPEAGRVTARRLNRAEYNNTIRDLLGVDTHPADGFPQDDSGYGFDDIGDVLSLSPVLMEKYLAAAENVSHIALFGSPVLKPSLVRLQPANRKIAPVYIVPEEYDLSGLSLPNALHATYRFPVQADYVLKAVLSGSRPQGSEPIQIAIWIDGRQVRTFVYDAGDNGPASTAGEQDLTSRSFEIRTRIPAGEHWLAASILHLYEGLPPSFGGPNPSTRPIPVREFKPPKDATEQQIAALKKKFDARQSEKKRANGDSIGRIEVVGPYNQAKGPSPESLKKIYICGHLDGHHQPGCARKIVANLAIGRSAALSQRRRSIVTCSWSTWLRLMGIRLQMELLSLCRPYWFRPTSCSVSSKAIARLTQPSAAIQA